MDTKDSTTVNPARSVSPTPTRQPALVSVVMPCYNAAPFLEEAVLSVMKQSYPKVELVVVDDGSTDNSVQLLERLAKEYPTRIRIENQQQKGPYLARNLGLTLARGEFIAFLDSDDWWREDFVEKLLQALQEHPKTALAYCGWQNIGVEGGRGEPYVPPDYELEGKMERFLRAASPWPIHAALTRRSAIEEAGGFQTWLPTCMDYDFWLRIGMTHPIIRVPEVMAFYRHHDHGQIVSTQWRQAENSWRVKKDYVSRHPELLQKLSREQLQDLIDGSLLRRGYDNYWRRDLVSARRIFRRALHTNAWKARDLRYLLPALLPEKLYIRLITLVG